MKNLTIFILILCLSSCDYFDKKKVNSQDIVNEELQTFNWKDVDEYPSFQTCESSSSKQESKQCFEATLTSHITSQLAQEKIVVTKDINDTVIINFLISEKGELNVLSINNSDSIKSQIPEIDSFFRQSLNDLPEIQPAFKRGQHVKTEFKLPVVIKVN